MPARRVANSEKRNPCTHMIVTRLFDQWGSFRCSLCHKHVNIGWLYRCTQDSDGLLPESIFINESHSHTKKSPSQDVALHTLSTPIIKAIGEGQYTDEQIKTLIQQKEHVCSVVLAQEPRPATASTATTTSSSSSSISSKYDSLFLPKSTTFSTTSTASVDEEIRKAYDWNELQKVWMAESTLAVSDFSSHTLTPSSMASPKDCSLMICPTCRPTYRERAFQSLDGILSSPVKIPPSWELENRPISDASVLAKIQVPPTQSRFYPRLGHSAVQSVSSFFAADEHVSVSGGEQKMLDGHSIRKRGGFRQTVRKALARVRSEETSTAADVNGDGEPFEINEESRRSRSHLFRRPRSRPTLSFVETHGQLVDTSGLQDSVMLMLASNTPLPYTPNNANMVFDSVDTGRALHSPPIQDGSVLQLWDIVAHA